MWPNEKYNEKLSFKRNVSFERTREILTSNLLQSYFDHLRYLVFDMQQFENVAMMV